MHKYKLLIAYDGTNYSGWQIQANALSIQSLIEKALHTLLKHPTSLTGAGRTDAGVHAHGQVAHFCSEKTLDLSRTQASLNGLLPLDVRILDIEHVTDDFHARYSAISKEYHYHLHLDLAQNPLKRLYSYHVLHRTNTTLLQEAALLFVGTHDFTSFASKALYGCAAKNPVRTIFRLDVIPEPGGLRLEFEGNGFLYKMVRNITGTLIDVGCGKITLEDIPVIFAKRDRGASGRIAPACGLFLQKVNYTVTSSIDAKCRTPLGSAESI